jgi:hypothetical protein
VFCSTTAYNIAIRFCLLAELLFLHRRPTPAINVILFYPIPVAFSTIKFNKFLQIRLCQTPALVQVTSIFAKQSNKHHNSSLNNNNSKMSIASDIGEV